MSSIACRCALVSANGSAASSRRANAPSARCARPGMARMRAAHEEQRELVGEQFVIGEAGRRRTGRVDVLGPRRLMHRAERLGERRQVQPAHGLVADPFRQPRQALERSLGGAGDGARVEAFGQPVDRLDRGQAGELLGVHHPVGMDDLPPAVPKLELARDPAPGPDRQFRAHPFVVGEEEDEFDVAGVVLDQHLERRARARVRRLAMLGHGRLDGHDRVGNRVADFRPRAPVDGRLRQVEEDVDHPRALGLVEQAVEEFRVLRPDSRQGDCRGEERIEERRTHDRPLAPPFRRGKRYRGSQSISVTTRGASRPCSRRLASRRSNSNHGPA